LIRLTDSFILIEGAVCPRPGALKDTGEIEMKSKESIHILASGSIQCIQKPEMNVSVEDFFQLYPAICRGDRFFPSIF